MNRREILTRVEEATKVMDRHCHRMRYYKTEQALLNIRKELNFVLGDLYWPREYEKEYYWKTLEGEKDHNTYKRFTNRIKNFEKRLETHRDKFYPRHSTQYLEKVKEEREKEEEFKQMLERERVVYRRR